jgi:hypothetical protein
MLIVGVDAPGVLPASPICSVMLATRWTTRNDGLPRNVGDDSVRLDGRGQCRLEQHQHGAADRGGLAQEPAHDEREKVRPCTMLDVM